MTSRKELNVSPFYWDFTREYSEDKDDRGFFEASAELVLFGMRNLRGRILRRSLLLGWILPSFSRSNLLIRHYSKLYGGAELGQLPREGPAFWFLSTSLTTGHCCAFTRDGYSVFETDGIRRYTAPDLPLGLAVAASSAFPPLFPAIPGGLNASTQHHLLLTKRGGVYGKTWTGRAELGRENRHVAPLEGGTPHAGDCAGVEV
jgi:hypothetical protein